MLFVDLALYCKNISEEEVVEVKKLFITE